MHSVLPAWMILEDVRTVAIQTFDHSHDLPAMVFISSVITARIEWCRRLKRQLGSEAEGWRAEEEGLHDALLNKDHTSHYRYSPPALFERYVMGLEDGRALIRAARVDWANSQLNSVDLNESVSCEDR